MRRIHQLFSVAVAACAVLVVVPASATPGKAADSQTSATTGAVEHSGKDLNQESLHAAQMGGERSSMKDATRPHQTAQLSRSAKNKAIRRAIAIRRARAAKAKKASG